MKVVTIVALMLLVALPAEAGQPRDQSTSQAAICDNDGHCTTFNAVSASVASNRRSQRKIYTPPAVATAIPTAGSVTTAPAVSTKEVVTPAVSATEAATTAPAVSTADSEVASEVTLQSVRRFDFDAAVLYSKILVVPLVLGTLTTETITTTVAATAAGFTEAKTTTSVTVPIPVARPLGAGGNNLDGIVMSAKTGARARVGVAYAARFQAYIDDLEKNYGARVLFMGGLRPGRCAAESEHPCGKALDVCQLRRGVVDPRCNLPGRLVLGQIAAAHGLFEGGRWCHSDYGHAQIDVTAPACGDSPIYIVRQMKPRGIGAVARAGSASALALSASGY